MAKHDELLEQNGTYANLYRMTYAEEQAQREQEMVGEDVAIARRRRAEEMDAAAPAGGS